MSDKNKQNLHYFEGSSMINLYQCIEEWQIENSKRLLSVNIQRDGDKFCCIALTNPTEVVLTDLNGDPISVGKNELGVNCLAIDGTVRLA